MATLSVGGDIQAYCGKCKTVQPHIIVAMKGTRAAKTECQTCNATHAYRKNPPDTRAKKRSQYEDAMEGRDVSKAIPYRTTRKFNEQDVIKHKTFGVGVVTRVVTDKKMEVMFEESTKLLIYGH